MGSTDYEPKPRSCPYDKNKTSGVRGLSWGDKMDDEETEERKHLRNGKQSKPWVLHFNAIENNDRGSRMNNSNANKENNPSRKFVAMPLETDKRKLQTRQRQLDIGKETIGYKKYTQDIRRNDRTLHHPSTPNKFKLCSTRSWQGTVRIWRRKLHYWDTPVVAKANQLKFVNLLTSPHIDDGSNDDEDLPQTRRIDNSIDNEDCVSEGSSQNSNECTTTDSNLLCDDPVTESMLFWNGI